MIGIFKNLYNKYILRINRTDKNGNRDGLWIYYWSNGKLALKTNYIHGKEHGYQEVFSNNGDIFEKGFAFNGKRHGYWIDCSMLDNEAISYSKGFYNNGSPVGLWEISYKHHQILHYHYHYHLKDDLLEIHLSSKNKLLL